MTSENIKVRIEVGDIVIEESPADVTIETDIVDGCVRRVVTIITKKLTRVTPLPPISKKIWYSLSAPEATL